MATKGGPSIHLQKASKLSRQWGPLHKPANYLILAAFLITLGIYRIPTPLGLTMTFSHVFLGLALVLGGSAFLSGTRKLKIDKETRALLTIFGVFIIYSFFSFLRNLGTMRRESMPLYFLELVGYAMTLSVPIFINRATDLQKLTKAFMASAIFVYLGAFWHLYNYYVLGQFVSGIPFWHDYTTSEYVQGYMAQVQTFSGFPRFTLPYVTPGGTGMYLSMAGILLLALTLSRISRKKGGIWLLVLLNFLNLFCLFGTFARASWVIFAVGSSVVLWYFRKLITFGKIVSPILILIALLSFLSLTRFSDDFYSVIGLRFNSEATARTNAGHLESRLLALEYSKENPVFGLGIGGFFLKPGGGIHTHSTYFTLLVDRGIIGLLLYLGFLVTALRVLKRRLRLLQESDSKNMRPYIVGLLGCLSGLFVGNFLYQLDTEEMWLLFGIVLGCIRLSSLAYRFVNPIKQK